MYIIITKCAKICADYGERETQMGRKLKLVIGIAAAVGLLVLAALMLLIRFGIIDEEFQIGRASCRERV